MAINDIFSKRQKRTRGELPDVYQYTELPYPFRVQVVYLWRETVGTGTNSSPSSGAAYEYIVTTLRKEYGVFRLPENTSNTSSFPDELIKFFLNVKQVEQALDAIELTFVLIDNATREFEFMFRQYASSAADNAIEELNERFREHGIGFQFVNGQIIRVDSELVHAEVVKPALHLLRQLQYAGAEEEFLKAHEHYRHGNAKEALNESLKAFESLMKAICDKRGWTYGGGDTAKTLIGICYERGLIPAFWQGHFGAIRTLLEAGVPTGRNKLSAHGQGTSATSVPNYLVAYMLHMTAAAIVCLAEAESNMP